MEVFIALDYVELSKTAASLIARVIQDKLHASIVAATGDTPMGVYQELSRRFRAGEMDTSRVRVFQLDEYAGIAASDRRSLYGWMKAALLDPLAIPPERTTRLRGDAPDLGVACREYDRKVREAGGFDLAILGLGPNGHLGFNEPPSSPDSPTREVQLAPESVRSNSAYWGSEDDVPRRAVTAGMDLLLAARRTVLVVSGERKREILARTSHGPVTPDVPASYLQRGPAVMVVADRAAAGRRA